MISDTRFGQSDKRASQGSGWKYPGDRANHRMKPRDPLYANIFGINQLVAQPIGFGEIELKWASKRVLTHPIRISAQWRILDQNLLARTLLLCVLKVILLLFAFQFLFHFLSHFSI